MPNPCDLAFFINEKCRRNPILPRSSHPRFRHFTLFAPLLVIERDAVSHFAAHFFYKWFHLGFVGFPNVLPNDYEAFVFEFIVDLIEMRNRCPARATPCCPKLHDICFARQKFFDRLALHPLPRLQLGRWITNIQSRFCFLSSDCWQDG